MSQLPVSYFEILKKKQEMLPLEDLPSRPDFVAFQLCSPWKATQALSLGLLTCSQRVRLPLQSRRGAPLWRGSHRGPVNLSAFKASWLK